MTKSIKNILLIVIAFVLMLSLTGCGFSSKAEKIASKWKEGKEYTIDEIKKELGEPTSEFIIEKDGFISWVEGCMTKEEAQEKWIMGETLPALVIFVRDEKIISIEYISESTAKDIL